MSDLRGTRLRRNGPDREALDDLLVNDTVIKEWFEKLGRILWPERKRLYPDEARVPEQVDMPDYKPIYTPNYTPPLKSYWRTNSVEVTLFDPLIEGSILLLYKQLLRNDMWQRCVHQSIIRRKQPLLPRHAPQGTVHGDAFEQKTLNLMLKVFAEERASLPQHYRPLVHGYNEESRSYTQLVCLVIGQREIKTLIEGHNDPRLKAAAQSPVSLSYSPTTKGDMQLSSTMPENTNRLAINEHQSHLQSPHTITFTQPLFQSQSNTAEQSLIQTDASRTVGEGAHGVARTPRGLLEDAATEASINAFLSTILDLDHAE